MLGSFIVSISIASLSVSRYVAYEVFADTSELDGGLSPSVSSALLGGTQQIENQDSAKKQK